MRKYEVSELLSKGYSESEVISTLTDKHGLADSTVERYIRQVVDEWVEQDVEKQKAHKSLAIQRHNELYRQAYSVGQFKTANDVQKEINKLHGLYDTDKKKVELPKIIKVSEKDQSLQLVEEKEDKAENG